MSVNAKLRHVSEKGCHHELTTPLIAAVYYSQQEFIYALVEFAPPSAFKSSTTTGTTTRTATTVVGTGATTDITTASSTNTINRQVGSEHPPSIESPPSPSHNEGLNINCTNLLGQTPLIYASSRGNEALVLYLLKVGADRNLRDGNGERASDWARKNKHTSIYMILICDPHVSSVHAAIREGNVEATVAYFKQNPNPNQRWFLNQPMHSVTSNLSPAAVVGAVGVVSGSGGEGIVGDATIPTMAIEGVLEGEPPLVVAAKFNRVPIINILLRAPGIDIDILDTFGKTPLMHASENGHEESVLLLLKHKANRNVMDYSQQTALHHAERGGGSGSGHASVAAILDADPYRVYIHDACENGEVDMVVALMKQGCPVNFRDERTGKF